MLLGLRPEINITSWFSPYTHPCRPNRSAAAVASSLGSSSWLSCNWPSPGPGGEARLLPRLWRSSFSPKRTAPFFLDKMLKFRHLPRILFVKQDQAKIKLNHDGLNLNCHIYNQQSTFLSLYSYWQSIQASCYIPPVILCVLELPSTWGGTRAPHSSCAENLGKSFRHCP